MSQQVTLAQDIYPMICLHEAILAYQEVCKVSVHHASEREYVIELEKRSSEVDERMFGHEFLNYLLDVSLEHHLICQ